MARTSLDLELDLQASRTRQRQLNEEIGTLRELRQRLEDAQLRGQTDLPHWVLRDDRFRSLLKEAERQVRGPRACSGLPLQFSSYCLSMVSNLSFSWQCSYNDVAIERILALVLCKFLLLCAFVVAPVDT